MKHKKTPARTKRVLWAAAFVVCLGVLVFAVMQIVSILQSYRAASDEYDSLRRHRAAATDAGEQPAADAPLDLSDINPDYIGWLTLPGTAIDYPLVQGSDNDRYLHTTFEGTPNPAGTIFMDTAATDAFAGRYALLYGHNMKDGSMFGGLRQYLDPAYLTGHPDIEITTPDGEVLHYRIFAAHKTTTDDAAYRQVYTDDAALAAFIERLGAPEGTEAVLALSTCTNDADNERILVYAARTA